MTFRVLLALGACAHKRPAEVAAPADVPAAEPTPAATELRSPVAGPVAWSGEGLCLAVPSGWNGTDGAPPDVLDLEAEGGSPRLAVHVLPLGSSPTADPEAFVLAFEDLASYRTVPLLTPSSLRSWRSVEPTGPERMVWWADVSGRTIAVEATFDHGRTTEGLDLVQPLLEALRLCPD
jgi:hypothetical protein